LRLPLWIVSDFGGGLCGDAAAVTVTIADNGTAPYGGSVLERQEGLAAASGG